MNTGWLHAETDQLKSTFCLFLKFWLLTYLSSCLLLPAGWFQRGAAHSQECCSSGTPLAVYQGSPCCRAQFWRPKYKSEDGQILNPAISHPFHTVTSFCLNWCFWTVVLEKTLESPLDCKDIKSVNPKGNQPWIFIERTDAEAGTPILWPPLAKSQFTGKDPDAGKDWGQEEKGTTEDEMVGWHHRLNGHEFEQVLGDGEGQGSLVCRSPTEQLNNNNLPPNRFQIVNHEQKL